MASRHSWKSSPDQVPIVLRWARKDLADVVEGLVERDCTKVKTWARRSLGKASIAWRSCSLRVIGCTLPFAYGRSLFYFSAAIATRTSISHSCNCRRYWYLADILSLFVNCDRARTSISHSCNCKSAVDRSYSVGNRCFF